MGCEESLRQPWRELDRVVLAQPPHLLRPPARLALVLLFSTRRSCSPVPDGGADRGGGVPGALAQPSQLQMRAIVRGAARGGVWVRVFLAVLGASAGTVGAGLLVFYGTCRRTTR